MSGGKEGSGPTHVSEVYMPTETRGVFDKSYEVNHDAGVNIARDIPDKGTAEQISNDYNKSGKD